MPFTPLHMGPGIAVKAVMQGSFSLMVFGWTQIVMDVQPLIVMLRGEGHLHGFTHTFVGATLIAAVSAITGKYLSELSLDWFRPPTLRSPVVSWPVSLLSALIGSYSHVVLDSIMHRDTEPLFPVTRANILLDLVSVAVLHTFCFTSGLLGAIVYCLVVWRRKPRLHPETKPR